MFILIPANVPLFAEIDTQKYIKYEKITKLRKIILRISMNTFIDDNFVVFY